MGQGESMVSLDKESAGSKTFLLSKNGTFLFLFGNGAFGSKWCGLWQDGTKFLDYFAWRVNDRWLSPDSFQGLEYDGVTAELSYDVGQPVTQRLCATQGGLVVQMQAQKKSRFQLELGVDIRRRDEDLQQGEYRLTKRSGIHVSNDLGRVSVRSKEADFLPRGDYGTHFPGRYAQEQGYSWKEGEQRRFVPGLLSLEGKRAEIGIAIDSRKLESFSKTKKGVAADIKAKASKSDWRTAASLSHFLTKRGRRYAFFAGFPYFNELWTRDFLWMAKPLMERGFTREVGDELRLIGDSQLKNGAVPNIVGNKGTNADSTPLWVIACDEFQKETGQLDRKRLRKALEFGRKRLKGGLVEHPASLTWMDTLERPGAVEVQSLWVEAFRRGAELLEDGKLEDAAVEVWATLEKEFLSGEVFRDSAGGPYDFTANCLVPVLFGQTSLGQRKRTLERAEQELVTGQGLKAVSKRESGWPEAYHERVWGLTTYWGLETLPDEVADRMLKGYTDYLDSRTLYGVPETISNRMPMGATHQLWSVAFLDQGGKR